MHIIRGILGFTAISSLMVFHDAHAKKEPSPQVSGIMPYSELTLKGGNKRDISRLDFFIPLFQDTTNLVGADIRLMGDTRRSREINLGVFYRRQIRDNWIGGLACFLDRRRTNTQGVNNHFSQLTLNAHILTDTWQGHINAYLPENKKKLISSIKLEEGLSPIRGQRRAYDYVITQNIWERPLGGWDIRLSRAVPYLNPLRLGVTAYCFGAKGYRDTKGYGAHLEYKVHRFLTLEAETNKDDVRGRMNYLTAILRIPLGGSPRSTPTAREELFQTKIYRDIDVVTTPGGTLQKTQTLNPNTFMATATLDQSNPQADGTFGNPYNIKDPEQCARIFDETGENTLAIFNPTDGGDMPATVLQSTLFSVKEVGDAYTALNNSGPTILTDYIIQNSDAPLNQVVEEGQKQFQSLQKRLLPSATFSALSPEIFKNLHNVCLGTALPKSNEQIIKKVTEGLMPLPKASKQYCLICQEYGSWQGPIDNTILASINHISQDYADNVSVPDILAYSASKIFSPEYYDNCIYHNLGDDQNREFYYTHPTERAAFLSLSEDARTRYVSYDTPQDRQEFLGALQNSTNGGNNYSANNNME